MGLSPSPEELPSPAAAPSLRACLRLALRPGRGLVAANLALRIAQGLLPLLGLVAMQRLVDAVANGLAAGPGNADDPASRSAVLAAVLFAAGLGLLGVLLQAIAARCGERHARAVADGLAADLQRHTARLDLDQLETPAVRDLLHRAAAESASRPVRTVQDLAALVVAAVGFVAMVAATGARAPWLPLAVALAVVPQVLARRRHANLRSNWQREHAEAQRQQAYLTGLLLGRPFAKDLRLLGLADAVATRAETEREVLSSAQERLAAKQSTAEAFAQATSTIALFGGYAWLAFAALRQEFSLGMLLLQVQAVQRTQNTLRDLLLAHAALREHATFVEPVLAFLALAPSPRAAIDALPRGAFAVRIERASYAYPGSPSPVLRELDLHVAEGQRVLVTGGNGAGKSTLVRLLAGLARPQQGRLEIGGAAPSDLSERVRSERVSVAFQDSIGLELALRDNLAFGSEPAGDSALRERIRAAGLEPLLAGLPGDFGVRLGRAFTGGLELSGGQWRRLALVRTLIRPCSLLVLDEPFAFLDEPARRALAAHLAMRSRDATIVVVDHRPPMDLGFDRRIELAAGRAAPPPIDTTV